MEAKNVAGAGLIALGLTTGVWGFLNAIPKLTNLGIAGIFLGLVVLAFKSTDYVKRESVDALSESYREVFSSLSENLYLEGNAVFIPPYENLPRGGLFIPLHRDFELDLARLDEKTVFLTDVPKDRQMGLFLGPFGDSLVRRFEDHFEGSLEGVGSQTVESVADSVLKYLELASRVYIEETERGFRIVVRPKLKCRPSGCEKIPCPVCASVLLALSKGTGQIIEVESIVQGRSGVEITARKLGGVGEWK